MENFYFLFEDIENWAIWDDKGYSIGFIILLCLTLLYLTIFYVVLGRQGMRFSSLGKWFLFGVFNMITIFFTTLVIEGFKVFELTSFGDFHYGVWLFAIINTLYSFILYFLLSLVFKRFSIFSKFYPVKF